MLPQRTRVIVVLLVVMSLTLAILDLRGGRGPFSSFRSVVSTVLGGMENGVSSAVSPVIGVTKWWGDWGDQRARIAQLEAANENLQGLVTRSLEDRARADALDQLLRVAGVGGYRIVTAEVIAVSPAQNFTWTITIDAGRNDGILDDMTVINGQGLVGRVLSLTKTTSTVVLLVDTTSSVGARVAGTEEIGILSGTGRQDSLEFTSLDPLTVLRPGQPLVTFGSRNGRPYAPGIPIGQIVDVTGTAGSLTRIAVVRPFVDVSTLTIVGVVVRPPRVNPRDSVLPPVTRPTPSPVPTPSEAPPSPQPSDSGTPVPESSPSPSRSTSIAQLSKPNRPNKPDKPIKPTEAPRPVVTPEPSVAPTPTPTPTAGASAGGV